MKQPQLKWYLRSLVFIVLAGPVLIAGFNWFVDPFNVYSSPQIQGFNAVKPEVASHLRLEKAHVVRRLRPAAVILGSSRAQVGINPDHGAWSAAPVYNLSLVGTNMYEMVRYFQHANTVEPLSQAVVFLDLFAFVEEENRADFSESRLAASYDGTKNPPFYIVPDSLDTLLSWDGLVASLKTVNLQTNNDLVYLENGMIDYSHHTVGEGYHAAFVAGEKQYINGIENMYVPEPVQWDDPVIARPMFEHYRKILQIAYRDDIDMRLAVSPIHARLSELLSFVGLWPVYEQWKRYLVQVNEEEAALAGKPPFPLWDFSGYNEFTTETVPSPGDTATTMQWYWEASHYKEALGDLMLDRILGERLSGSGVPDDFGVMLTSQNIEEHLEDINDARRDYENTHPADVAEVAEESRP